MTNRKEFNDYIVRQTFKYQKKYGFELGNEKERTHNNEADAFKHTYLSAWLTIRHGSLIANVVGDWHEDETWNSPAYETNMDKWNNAIGREIGKEIKNKIKGKNYLQSEIEDMIAEKIMQKMRKGDLITNPLTDNRIFDKKILKDLIYDLRNRIFYKNELTMKDLENPQIKEAFLDQITDWKPFPTKESLDKRVAIGELVYVEDYIRSDGTKVSGYYRAYPKR